MTVLEYGNDMIIVDCGVSFPKEDSPGIDAIIPDITYIKENIARLRGIVLTHGHEDHIGAIPYYADDLKTSLSTALRSLSDFLNASSTNKAKSAIS